MTKFFPLLFAAMLLVNLSFAQQLLLEQSNASAVYATGDSIRLTATLLRGTADSVQISIRKDYHLPSVQKKVAYQGAGTVLYATVATAPGSLILEASTTTDTNSIGVLIAPDRIHMDGQRPADIDQFWDKERKILRALPLQIKRRAVAVADNGVVCFDTEINCTGPAPARGYFAKPQKATSHSLPIVLFLHAAGVKGNWCQSAPANASKYAAMGKGALCFDLNAHGMLNGQPQRYYDSLEETSLKDYYTQGNDSKEHYYFKGMYLRLMRTIDYLTKQPEWDGKRILVMGESQGGGQALVAAGLDKRVTAAVATVPAMCGYSSTLYGGKGGWPNPYLNYADTTKANAVFPYFDAGWLLQNSHATIVTEIGLIDFTCPSTGIYAAVNQAKGKKIIYPVPYRAHHMSQPYYQSLWNTTVRDPKDQLSLIL